MSTKLPTMGKTPPSSYRGKRKRGANDGGPTPSGRGARYHCNYCHKDISGVVRIKCAVCPDFDLCLECFSVGVEVHPHKNTHGYRVVDDLSFPMFSPEWGADEELLLLEGVDMYGLGNWASVSEHVGTKSGEECERHYYTVYLRSKQEVVCGVGNEEAKKSPKMAVQDTPLPLETPPVRSKRQKTGSSAEEDDGKNEQKSDKEGVGGSEAPKPPQSPSKLSDGRKNCSDGSMVSAPTSQAGLGGEAEGDSGVRPGHSDAPQVENSETGELELKETRRKGRSVVEPDPKTKRKGDKLGWDDQDGVGGNTYEITGYNPKRDEFDPEYDNDAERVIADLEFNADDPEEIVEKKLRLLEIYNHRLDERDKRRNFVKDRKLLNVKKQQAIEKKQRRPAELKDLYSNMRVFARFLPVEEYEVLVEGLFVEQKLRERIQQLKEFRRRGYRTFGDIELSERTRNTPKPGLLRFERNCGCLAKSNDAQVKATAQILQNWRNKRGVNLDITLLPGWELLSSKERELCVWSRFVPAHYLALKDRLLREAEKLGFFPRQDVRTFFRLEANKALKVYDLMLNCGWIKGSASEAQAGDTPGE